MTCDPGTWTGALGLSVQWNRDGTPVPGATTANYLVGNDDVGHQLTCSVIAVNPLGQTIVISNPVGPVPGGSPGGTTPVKPNLPSAKKVIVFPKGKTCKSRKKFKISVKASPGITYSSAKFFIHGKKKKTITKNQLSFTTTLSRLPHKRFTLKVTLKISDGRKIVGSHKYKRCR